MEYKVLLSKKVRVYGTAFRVELRKHRDNYYQLVDVYERCEHDRGIPYRTLGDALRGFEAATGTVLTKEIKNYLGGNKK